MQSFELRLEDVPSQQALINFAVSLQDSNQWLVPLVTLTIQFPVSWCIRPHCNSSSNGSQMHSNWHNIVQHQLYSTTLLAV